MSLRGVTYRLGQLHQRVLFAASGASSYARLRVQERNGHTPKVAAVIVGRNDDYMPDFAQRLHATVAWNIRHLVNEVIFVEWNPPADRPLLASRLTSDFPAVSAYVVPPEIHQALCQNDRLALMEYHAKNVGIRRARSSWIIATNADVAFGGDAIQAIRSSLRSTDMAWTAERVDINWEMWREREIGLRDCLRYKRIIPYIEHGTGDFLLASREMWHRVRGYDENLFKHRIGCDVRGAGQMLAHGASIHKIGSILHLAHPTSCSEGVQPHHGELASLEGLPYENSPDWGLGKCSEVPLGERIWRLEFN